MCTYTLTMLKKIIILLIKAEFGWCKMAGNKMVYEGGNGEIVEKKSRFIASVFSVHSEEEATGIIESVKKKYWDARHNCYAFVIGNNSEIQRYSDDGEPGGTAGRPMLEILLAEKMVDCLVIVTRYFGGTLLGTGGLVRAYQQATKEGLANSEICELEEGVMYSADTDYNNVGKVQYLAGNENLGAYIVDNIYTDKVTFKILIRKECEDAFVRNVTESTNGKVIMEKEGNAIFIIRKGKPRIL